MPLYTKLSGTNPAMLKAMGLYPNMYDPPIDTKKKFVHQLQADRGRERTISFNRSNAEFKNEIYNPAFYEQMKVYTHGDFAGRVMAVYFTTEKMKNKMVQIANKLDDYTKAMPVSIAFSYRDDEGILCGLALAQYSGEYAEDSSNSKPLYAITVVRNTHAPNQERSITFISASDLLGLTNFDQNSDINRRAKTNIPEGSILTEIKADINSEKIYELVSGILENNEISETKYLHLQKRIMDDHFDHRDITRPQITRLLKLAQYISPQVYEQCKTGSQSLNFYEESHYIKLLSRLLSASKRINPRNQEAITIAKGLLIEFFVAKHYQFLDNFALQELSPQQLTFIREKVEQAVSTDDHSLFDENSFNELSNEWHQSYHFQECLLHLKEAIFYCENAAIQKELQSKLPAFEKLASKQARLNLKQKNIVLTSLSHMYAFAHNPTQLDNLNNWKKTYRDFQWDIPQLIAQQQTFAILTQSLNEKSHSISNPFIKQEILTRLSSLKNLQIDTYKPESREIIIQLVETLNNFVETPNEDVYNKLKHYYKKFHITLPPSALLLQSPELANCNYMLSKTTGSYCYDSQGRMVYDAVNNKGQIVMVSRDIQSATEQQAFETALSNALKDKTQIGAKIIEGYRKIPKHNILPIQQELQIYIHTLTNQYQQIFVEYGFNEQECSDLMTQTLSDINQRVMDKLATGLVGAFIRDAKLSRSPDLNHLNRVLKEGIEELKHESKEVFHTHIKKKYAQKIRTQNFNLKEAKHPLIFYHLNKDLGLSTYTEIKESKSGVTYQQITTFHINEQLEAQEKISRLRLQMIASVDNLELFGQSLNDITAKYKMKNQLTSYAFIGPYAEDSQPLDMIQSHLSKAHQFNREHLADDQPIILVQAIDQSGEGHALGYSFLDLTGTRNEATLMAEMAMCANISNDFDLTPYRRFLTSPQTMLSTLYQKLIKSPLLYRSAEGSEMLTQIQHLKTQWQIEANTEAMNDEDLIKKALQKLMAFDLHFGHEYANLLQAMSLTIDKQALIHSNPNTPTWTLNDAQMFDAINRFPRIKAALTSLAHAQDKPNAIAAADALKNNLKQMYDDSLQQGISPLPNLVSQATGTVGTEIKQDLQNMKQNIALRLQHDAQPSNQAKKSILKTTTVNKRHQRTQKSSNKKIRFPSENEQSNVDMDTNNISHRKNKS
ncbi:MAG TPA: hypothetical protein VHD33_02120 [Legionellaceae bacterium]|nr:hypothetical protein [Legionellaceae bacterium]